MSNIFTDFVRVYPQPGQTIDRVEATWITWALLGPRGSYHVPVVTRRDAEGRYVDIQYGSGKSADIVDFCENNVGYRYRAIWGRRFDEGADEDVIWQDDVNDGPRRYCRYGFDEVRVVGDRPPVAAKAPADAPWQRETDGSSRRETDGSWRREADGSWRREADGSWRREADGSWRLKVAGSYRTGNDRAAEVGAAATPDDQPVPGSAGRWGEPLLALDPPWLGPLADEPPGVTLVEFFWQGRLVHRARKGKQQELPTHPVPKIEQQGSPARQDQDGGQPPRHPARENERQRPPTQPAGEGGDAEDQAWRHHCADDWDNCLDPEFLRFTGATHLLAPDHAYERDRQDWQDRPRYRG